MSATLSPIPSIESLPPFRRSADEQGAMSAQITGIIPDWLRGEVVRTCPAVFETSNWRAHHWFDGLGMIYAFRIGNLGVDFRSRLLDSEIARDAWRGEANLGSFGTPTKRTLIRRIFEPIPRISDNTNVNITRFGMELVALTESARQNVIDGETLALARPLEYAHDSLGRAILSAHPHFDFERGKVVNVATSLGVGVTISIYEHAPATRRREVVGSWKSKRVPYIHTFGLTPKNAILVAHPLDAAPVKMLWSSKGFIDHFAWRPEQGTQLVVIDRTNGTVREHITDAFFCFHTVHAFERGAETVLDLLAYPNADIMWSLRTERMAARLPDLAPFLVRVVLRPGVERASVERIGDVGFEFPSTNYRRVSGKPYRFAFGASNVHQASGAYESSIVKMDVDRGHATLFSEGTYIFGEPLFVARPGGKAEDDGVLLTVGAARDAATSMLAIIDAQSMELVASAKVPIPIPLGFHGSFVPKEG